MDIISRADAKAAGKKFYFTGKPCKRGHISERYVSDYSCVECLAKRYAERKSAGMCVSHPNRPAVGDGAYCQECLDWMAEYNAKRYAECKSAGMCTNHPDRPAVGDGAYCQECLDRRAEYNAKRRAECKAAGMCKNHPNRPAVNGGALCQECLDRKAKWRRKHPEHYAKWQRANPGKVVAKVERRRARKQDALPDDPDAREDADRWFRYLRAVAEYYGEQGIEAHVDHIFPLSRADEYPGLFPEGNVHVMRNLQLLSARDNASKHNKHPWEVDVEPLSAAPTYEWRVRMAQEMFDATASVRPG